MTLTEIIPGKRYLRRDGKVMIAKEPEGWGGGLTLSMRYEEEDRCDEFIRWTKSGLAPESCPASWDKNMIAGAVPLSINQPIDAYSRHDLIECLDPDRPAQVQLGFFDD